jgi:hypothetical protein
VILSGIVLAGSTALRIRQVARERARVTVPPEATDEAPVSGLTSAPPADRPTNSERESGTLDV